MYPPRRLIISLLLFSFRYQCTLIGVDFIVSQKKEQVYNSTDATMVYSIVRKGQQSFIFLLSRLPLNQREESSVQNSKTLLMPPNMETVSEKILDPRFHYLSVIILVPIGTIGTGRYLFIIVISQLDKRCSIHFLGDF